MPSSIDSSDNSLVLSMKMIQQILSSLEMYDHAPFVWKNSSSKIFNFVQQYYCLHHILIQIHTMVFCYVIIKFEVGQKRSNKYCSLNFFKPSPPVNSSPCCGKSRDVFWKLNKKASIGIKWVRIFSKTLTICQNLSILFRTITVQTPHLLGQYMATCSFSIGDQLSPSLYQVGQYITNCWDKCCAVVAGEGGGGCNLLWTIHPDIGDYIK